MHLHWLPGRRSASIWVFGLLVGLGPWAGGIPGSPDWWCACVPQMLVCLNPWVAGVPGSLGCWFAWISRLLVCLGHQFDFQRYHPHIISMFNIGQALIELLLRYFQGPERLPEQCWLPCVLGFQPGPVQGCVTSTIFQGPCTQKGSGLNTLCPEVS